MASAGSAGKVPVFNPRGGTAAATATGVNRRSGSKMQAQASFEAIGSSQRSGQPTTTHAEAPVGWCTQQLLGLKKIFIQPIHILLLFVPLGIVAGVRDWGALPTFSFNFVAIVPLAAVLGASTEALAQHTGQMIGGLLNATFGNAVEMIVTINAIRANLVSVVQQSLIGSILSNLLLVLGMAFFSAGLVNKESSFNAAGAGTNVSCLVLSSLALTLPTVFAFIPNTTVHEAVELSRVISLVMALVYVAFLVFQLRTHVDLFSGAEEDAHEEEALLGPSTACVVLLGATAAVAICSEYLVGSIEGVSEQYHLPKAFIGLILLPIVGNAAEHATAVTAAYKGMMDLALGVAVGSSTQIALFVVPFSVIIGWIYDVEMSLNFQIFDTCVFLLSVFIASGILGDGHSNWFEGLMLCSTYVIVAIITWFIPEAAKHHHRALSEGLPLAPPIFV